MIMRRNFQITSTIYSIFERKLFRDMGRIRQSTSKILKNGDELLEKSFFF
jgi:hypothetical protein